MPSSSKLIVFFICAVFCGGCASTSPLALGISEEQWEEFSQEKQDELLHNYSILQAQDKTLTTTDDAVETKEPALIIKVHHGQAMLPPFLNWSPYKECKFYLAKNTCSKGTIHSLEAETTIDLKACYFENLLYIDPTKYDPNNTQGTVTFTYSPLWRQGFSYTKIHTDGYVRLKDATVYVKLLTPKVEAKVKAKDKKNSHQKKKADPLTDNGSDETL